MKTDEQWLEVIQDHYITLPRTALFSASIFSALQIAQEQIRPPQDPKEILDEILFGCEQYSRYEFSDPELAQGYICYALAFIGIAELAQISEKEITKQIRPVESNIFM